MSSPWQLARRAETYHQLHSLLQAGIGLLPGLEMLSRRAPEVSLRPRFHQLVLALREGSSFTEALRRSGRWLPAFDIALLDAGERSGRLPECLKMLALHYEQRAQLMRLLIGMVAYPVLLVHLALLIFPVSALQDLVLRGNILGFFVAKLAVLVPAYAVVFMGSFLISAERSEGLRSALERVLHRLPLIGKARRSLALARLSAALEALINAGVNIIESWGMAADASGSPALRRSIRAAVPKWQQGATPGETVSADDTFPSFFASSYATGEVSGRLDESLRRLNAHYQDEASRLSRASIIAVASTLVFSVMLVIAWQVIAFYLAYFKQISDVIPE